MAFDFKKEYREFYLPKGKPEVIEIPTMKYIAVSGQGDPNAEGGEYKSAVAVLYAVAYTLKMSYKGERQIDGFYQYVVPPLEGFWEQRGFDGFDHNRKSEFLWTSVIRLPEFVSESDFEWARAEAEAKKKIDCSKAEYITLTEGLVVQMMHTGAFDDEPASVALMDEYISENGYRNDFSQERRHHEIYLSDPRKVDVSRCKTVLRHPIARL